MQWRPMQGWPQHPVRTWLGRQQRSTCQAGYGLATATVSLVCFVLGVFGVPRGMVAACQHHAVWHASNTCAIVTHTIEGHTATHAMLLSLT